jgi:itaconate CoA-transferase
MSQPAYFTSYGGVAPPRSGPNHASIAPYGPFKSGDGQDVYLGIQNSREWARFCTDVLGRPDLVDDDRFRSNVLRVQHRDVLHAAIALVFHGLTAREILDRLEAAQIASGHMNSIAAFVDHPQLAARGDWRDIDSPAGPLRALRPPVRLDGVEPVMGAIPALGQHSQAILEELGFDSSTIATWRQEGTIR